MSQTEGKEIPEFSERVSGSAEEYRDRLLDFVIAQGIALEFKESIAPSPDMSYGGKIALLRANLPPRNCRPLGMN